MVPPVFLPDSLVPRHGAQKFVSPNRHSTAVSYILSALPHRAEQHVGKGTPTSGQFSRWGPARPGLRPAHGAKLPRKGVLVALSPSVPGVACSPRLRRDWIPAGRLFRAAGGIRVPVLVEFLKDPARAPHRPHHHGPRRALPHAWLRRMSRIEGRRAIEEARYLTGWNLSGIPCVGR